MKVIVTEEQLHMKFTSEMCHAAGYTDEILINAGFENGITLNDCYIGDVEKTDDGRNIVNPNLSNPNKLPRRVAFKNITEEQKFFLISIVGEENIIE